MRVKPLPTKSPPISAVRAGPILSWHFPAAIMANEKTRQQRAYGSLMEERLHWKASGPPFSIDAFIAPLKMLQAYSTPSARLMPTPAIVTCHPLFLDVSDMCLTSVGSL